MLYENLLKIPPVRYIVPDRRDIYLFHGNFNLFVNAVLSIYVNVTFSL